MRHAVKLGFLAAGLGFLFWWGWAGNFIFTPGSLFRLTARSDYYVFTVGGRDMGFSRREVDAGAPDQGFSITEESLVRLALPLGAAGGELRLRSEASYGPDGRLREAEFTAPGIPGASARARVADGFLDFTASFGSLSRKVSLKLPPEGPVLISGVVPWLSRQREIPLGKVLHVRVFDPVRMGFETARLTVEDFTEAADEVQVYKVELALPEGGTTEWLDANGRMLRQRMDRYQAWLELIPEGDPALAAAEGELAKAPVQVDGALVDLASRYFMNMAEGAFESLE
ncbi:MAG: hypothetical protein LBG06_07925 [Deltaproteobacteria bacterium]|nr:hypothetical protein [Deltaproteobacteria bacterium]